MSKWFYFQVNTITHDEDGTSFFTAESGICRCTDSVCRSIYDIQNWCFPKLFQSRFHVKCVIYLPAQMQLEAIQNERIHVIEYAFV